MSERFEIGVNRVQELENILGEILDLHFQGELMEVDADGVCAILTEPGQDAFDRAATILGDDPDNYPTLV